MDAPPSRHPAPEAKQYTCAPLPACPPTSPVARQGVPAVNVAQPKALLEPPHHPCQVSALPGRLVWPAVQGRKLAVGRHAAQALHHAWV